MFIDADSHVDECEATWSYIPQSHRHLVPRTIEFTADEIPPWLTSNRSSGSGLYRCWFIDGRFFPRRVRDDERTGTLLETRELVDIDARLSDMDQLGVDVQVIYPTTFLDEVSEREDILVPLHRSYNRWLADRCADSQGRLRWVAMIPYASIPDSLAEMRWAKEHGAVGIFKIGVECGGRSASDPYFLPIYRLAAELDLAICIHQAKGLTPVTPQLPLFKRGDFNTYPVLAAFAALLSATTTAQVPNLRVGFIEAGSAWVPHLLGSAGWRWDGMRSSDSLFSELNFYVTCETYEDLPYIINVMGSDDNLVVGSDYTHGDRASVKDAHQKIIGRTDIEEKSALKITSENARKLYHL